MICNVDTKPQGIPCLFSSDNLPAKRCTTYRVLQSSCNERLTPEMTLPIKLTGSHVRFIIASFDWPTFYFRFDRALQELCIGMQESMQTCDVIVTHVLPPM